MKTLIVILSFLSSAQALVPGNELVKQIENYSVILADNENHQYKAWYWDVIRIRTVLEAGVDIPIISRFSIRPEVELFFTHK